MTDQVLMYAAGALSDAEAEEVRRHLAGGCPRCAGLMAEAEATVALLALTLPPVTPSADAGRRLMNRVAEEKLAPIAAKSTPPQAQPIPWLAVIGIPSAIAAAVAAGLTIFFALKMPQMQPSVPELEAVSQERVIGLLTEEVERDQHEISALRTSQQAQLAQWITDPNLKLVSLSGTDQQPSNAAGRIIWDVDKGVWHFFARGIKPAATGKTYELWFVSSDGKMALPAGEFDPTPEGDASLVTNVPPVIAPKLTIGAVTDEPAGKQITAPSGSFQLKGSIP